MTKRTTGVTLALTLGLVLCLALAACGGSTGDSASPTPAAAAATGGTGSAGDQGTSPTPAASAATGGDSGTGGTPTARDTTQLALAIRGHWKDTKGADQYFNGKVWTTVTAGGRKSSLSYEVRMEAPAHRQLVLRTFKLEDAGGQPDQSSMRDVIFTFSNDSLTTLKWGGLTAQYVDEREQP